MQQYNIQYNIPRVYVQLPGRQNRLADGEFRITPGLTEVVQFYFGNQDGVPLNLTQFDVRFVVWSKTDLDSNKLSLGDSEILLNKSILIDNPYSAIAELLLDEKDTQTLANSGNRGLRWSLFVINRDNQVFPLQVSRSGGRYGTIVLDVESGIPISELIRKT